MSVVIEIIQAVLLIISAILMIIVAYGLLNLDNQMDKALYVRIHILGVFDMACVLAFIALNQVFLGILYFVLAPFVAHAISNAFYYSEDESKDSVEESNYKFMEGK